MKINYNGMLLDEEQFDFDLTNLSYKDGFFTTTKYEKNDFFQWDAHLNRLYDSLIIHGIAVPKDDLKKQCRILLRENNLTKARIKIIIFQANREVNYAILMQELQTNNKLRRLKLKLKENSEQKHFRFKTANYNYYLRLNEKAHQLGFDDFLFYDDKKRILETTFCNIFFQIEDKILTPGVNQPILPGICREFQIKVWRSKGFEVLEREIFLDELHKFTKCYVSNSIHGLVKAEIIR